MKLTPLNIALACILVWIISEWSTQQELLISWGWVALLAVILTVVDLGFRMLVKELKQLWMLQIGFILMVGILVIILKIQ